MSFSFGTDGSKHEALIIPGGGSRIPNIGSEGADSSFNQTITDAKGNPWTLGNYCSIWMDPMGIYTFSTSVVPPHIQKHLKSEELEAKDVDRLFLHQANKIIVDSIAKRVGIRKDRVPDESLSRYGNLGVSSIPALICAHYAKENSEPSVTGHKTSMLCSFGAGLSWASAILSLDKTVVLPVCDYMQEQSEPRAKRIQYWHSKFSGRKTRENS
ncbi:MAG: 3-oxoacyl-[acyl-carrier-protein] synthase III C-terminal domain-containing protein [Desulfovibrio sp.]|nr:3-oxoacyl-[acyl-carrier-protein] synthase III C-terminal domain-containing protein [Desulfovibrio sp.]